MKTILISLISDQTLPNVHLIKEFINEIDDLLFISTEKMEKKGCRKWIEKAINKNSDLEPIIVEQFSFEDLMVKLDQLDFTKYDRIILNITGGTKILTLTAHEYFKQLGAEIFYVTGQKNEYIKIFPGRSKKTYSFKSKITLNEYLDAHGCEIVPSTPSGIPMDYTYHMFSKYCESEFEEYFDALSLLRNKRKKGISDLSKSHNNIIEFLNYLDFKPTENRLSSSEVKYLTGEWLEEYIGYKLKEELELNNDELMISVTLNKELPMNKINSIEKLLGDKAYISGNEPSNEIDIMFTFNSKFYTIECKTSIINKEESGSFEDGRRKIKDRNILGETIYKCDYLKNRFGLFAQPIILTLTNFEDYICKSASNGEKKNRSSQMEELINRCNLSNIKLIDRIMLNESISIKQLII